MYTEADIPENWRFPQRTNPYLKVTQFDKDKKFLSIDLPDLNEDFRKRYPHYKGEYMDFVFGDEGKPKSQREVGTLMSRVIFRGETGEIYYYEELSEGKSQIEIVRMPVEMVDFPNIDKYYFIFAGLSYENGILQQVRTGRYFRTLNRPGEDSVTLASPQSYVWRNYFMDPEKNSSWSVPEVGSLVHPIQVDRHNFEFPDPVTGEKWIQLHWQIMNGFMYLVEEYPTVDMTKIIRAPLRLDTEDLKEAFFSKGSYPEVKLPNGGPSQLVIPWMNIPRMIGATLEYQEQHKIKLK